MRKESSSVRLNRQLSDATKAYAMSLGVSESDVIRMCVEHFFAPYTIRAHAMADVANQFKEPLIDDNDLSDNADQEL